MPDLRGTALRHPVRLVPFAFLGVIAVGTALLSLPAAHATGETDLLVAVFTAVSTVCVTGLATVDTTTYWTPFGQALILLLVQVGGFGIMTLATLIVLALRGRVGIRDTLNAGSENANLTLGDVRVVLVRIAKAVFLAEAVVSAMLFLRFWLGYGYPLGKAAWHGLFHGVMAFNNGGMTLYTSSLIPFVTDAWIILPICVGVVAGSIGFPVAFELRKRWRKPSAWSTHTRLTLYGYAFLFVAGFVGIVALEWSNPATFGPLDGGGKTVAGILASVTPRSAGFNSIDYTHIRDSTLLLVCMLMFIGGGSASTGGGIKVSTFFVLAFAIHAEAAGERDVLVGHRRIPDGVVRQALAVALLAVGVVVASTMVLSILTPFDLKHDLFEVVSAFATCGLSTGITPRLPPAAQVVVMACMFVGRVGIVTAASAFAVHTRKRRFSVPEEAPIVG